METDGRSLLGTIRAGDRVAGKYRVDSVLGAGGMGVVVAATHEQLHRKVAIKLLLPQTLERTEMLDRFQREARAAATLKSDHVAQVLDVGVLDNGAPYMVMEHLEGCDLSEVLRIHGPLPTSIAAEFLLQACEAIGEAHEAGIIHRDIKPSNLFLTRTVSGATRVKVLDFGISKLRSSNVADDVAATRSTVIMGSPLYMSPEQMRASKDADRRSDIWSLGVVLFELLSGAAPWGGRSILEVIAGVMSTPAPHLTQLRGAVPQGISDVVQRCLEKEPHARYQRVEELVGALSPYRHVGSTDGWDLGRVLAKAAEKANGDSLADRGALSIGSSPTELAGAAGGDETSTLAPARLAPATVDPSASTESAALRRAPSPGVSTTAAIVASDARESSFHTRSARPWLVPAIAAVATLAVGATLAVLELRRIPATPPVARVKHSAVASVAASTTPAPVFLVHPCAKDADPPAPARAWCDPAGASIATCARGLVPTGRDGICTCAPGGTEEQEMLRGGCQAPRGSAEERTQEVRAVVAGLKGAFRACYNANLETSPALRGKVKVEVELTPDGRVFSAKMLESSLPDAATQECVLQKLKAAEFPAPADGHATLAIPLTLELSK